MADLNEPKKETVRITLPPRPASRSAPNRPPRKETVRITLPSRPPAKTVTPLQSGEGEDDALRPGMAKIPTLGPVSSTDRTQAPVSPVRRPPMAPPVGTPSTDFSSLLTRSTNGSSSNPAEPAETPPAVAPPASELSSPPRIYPDPPTRRAPKKETARINLAPEPPAPRPRPVNMAKTQPLLVQPNAGVQPVRPVTVATAGALDPFDSLPKSFCWGLFGISAVTCLIQIWSYFSS